MSASGARRVATRGRRGSGPTSAGRMAKSSSQVKPASDSAVSSPGTAPMKRPPQRKPRRVLPGREEDQVAERINTLESEPTPA
eukprot:scaffold114129_cov25-Prasinocladus_malaysianus.AAC.1